MPALPNRVLLSKLGSALPDGRRFETGPEEVHPAVAVVPGFGRARLYLWTVTADRSKRGRPPGEFKIQLILPGQPKAKGPTGSLDLEGAYTVLLGYSPDFGVFVGWEARLYQRFAYSSSVQCREELLKEARNSGWAVSPPRKAGGSEEVRVAFTPGNLLHYLRTSRSADNEEQVGKWREAYFLAQTPNVRATLPTREKDLGEQVERQRQRVAAMRLVRDAKFSVYVRQQYDYACAVCQLQLEIVEGAHIIPVCEAGSSDAVWNGVALCPNHHELFDGNAFVIEPGLQVRVDDDRVEYLQGNDQAEGLEILTDFAGKSIRPPRFWKTNAEMRERMRTALERRTTLAGLA